MPPTRFNTREVRRDECRRNAVLVLVADQVIGVVQLEGKAEDRRDGRQRDVAFFPVQSDTGDALTLPGALADDTGVDNGCRIGTCL